jgi:predicted LPLAT superfamily acyltransferase
MRGKTMGDQKTIHWSEYKEEAAGYWQIKLLFLLFRILPVFFLRLYAFPVSFFYWVFSKRAREESCRFLEKAAVAVKKDSPGKKTSLQPLKHILACSLALVEKMEAWGGKVLFNRIHFQEDDITDLVDRLEKGEGALLICSHLGNSELLRALADYNRTGVSRNIPVTAVLDVSVTALFNRLLRELNPRSVTRIINARDIGPDTVVLLLDRINAGELVVIAGDRTSVHTRSKYIPVPFLNQNAPFPYGPFILAALLKVPTYFVFALRQGDLSLASRYDMHVHKSPVSFDCPRRERENRIRDMAFLFAEWLEFYCKQHPYQWYNFYDFWALPADTVAAENRCSPPVIPVTSFKRQNS